jgi:uncharacterized protein YprB with RNaseH-like and TPR domain
LDSCEYQTYLHADLPYVVCRAHGTQELQVPWADAGSAYTKQFERLVVGILDECKLREIETVLGLTREEAQEIRGRAIRRREARKRASFLEHQSASDMMSHIHNGTQNGTLAVVNGSRSTCARRRFL